jgi:hypothetical protein
MLRADVDVAVVGAGTAAVTDWELEEYLWFC